MAARKVDPILVEVLNNAFMSIAEEIGTILVRTAYSTNIKERKDCSCAIFDTDGTTIAQAEHIPVHLGSMLGIVQEIKKKYPLETIQKGDMFIANDPYTGGGSHLPDITVAAPVFYGDEIVAFVANIAHHSDIGGCVAGGAAPDSTSIFMEGLRLPPIKIVEAGEVRNDIIDIIALNCRTGHERPGDIMAQITGNRVGAERLVDLMHKHGKDTVLAGMQELINYGERKMRMALSALPDGEYEFEDWMDDDGVDFGVPFKIRVKATISGDSIHLDFTGSSKQVKGAINVIDGALKATVYYALKAIVDPTLPPNGGFYKPISIYAPEGCIVNPVVPASVGARTDTCQRVADVVFGALGQIDPRKIMAGCSSVVQSVVLSGHDEQRNKFFVYPETIGGGFGARYNKDGLDGVQCHVTNSSNLPIECMENEYPIMMDRYEIRMDSGGAGKYRGGLGIRRNYRILQDTTFGSHADRQMFPPWGLEGGLEGECGAFIINPDTDHADKMKSGKVSNIPLKQGDILSAMTPGSGGMGNPLERKIEMVLDDVLDEKVSLDAARRLYGVAIDPVTFEVNMEETQKLRGM